MCSVVSSRSAKAVNERCGGPHDHRRSAAVSTDIDRHLKPAENGKLCANADLNLHLRVVSVQKRDAAEHIRLKPLCRQEPHDADAVKHLALPWTATLEMRSTHPHLEFKRPQP